MLPLDAALEYIRARGLPLVPVYLMAMLPMSVCGLFLIDAVSAQHRSSLAPWCAGLVAATVWRWGWLARMQQSVQQAIQARPGATLRSRLLWILLVRLYANVATTWGSVLLAPGFYGMFVSAFATPLLLEHEGPFVQQTVKGLGWIHHSAARLMRVSVALSVLLLALVGAAFVMQKAILFALPHLLDIDSTSLALTFHSTAWRLSLLYFVFLFFDYFWTIAAVFLYYDSQSRRTGSDLRARLTLLTLESRRAA